MWSTLTSWNVVGPVCVALVGFGLATTLGGTILNVPYEYTLARIFYALGFSILLARIGYLLAFELSGNYSLIGHLIATAIIFAIVGVLWVGSALWVAEREHRQAKQSEQQGDMVSVDSPKLPPTTSELMHHLEEQIKFIQMSCKYFDQGLESEAKRIATGLHILFISTKDNPSLLEQLRIRDELTFPDTAIGDHEGNIMPYHGLVGIILQVSGARYSPFCLMPPHSDTHPKYLLFKKWWQAVIINDKKGIVFTRETLVLAVSKQDGGISVSSKLDQKYVDLARKNAMGWETSDKKPLLGVELSSIRQIGWEVLEGLRHHFPEYFETK